MHAHQFWDAEPVLMSGDCFSGEHASTIAGLERSAQEAGEPAQGPAQSSASTRRKQSSKKNAASSARPASARSNKPAALPQEPPAKKWAFCPASEYCLLTAGIYR